jgi:hypothetical protein
MATQIHSVYEGVMKRQPSLAFVCIFFFLAAVRTVFGQAECSFNIAGDWEATAPKHAGTNLYRFTTDGTVIMFSNARPGEERRELSRAKFHLIDTNNSRTLEFKPAPGSATFPWDGAKMQVTHVDQASFITLSAGLSTSWSKKDSNQYYVVLAAHRGTPPHQGGPAFAALIKASEGKPTAETFGLFYRNGERVNGPVPDDLYQRFMADPLPADDAILRLQISSQAFESAMKIMRTWQERAHTGTLLFPSYSYLNVIVPLRDIADSLNQCGTDFHAYKLTWMVDDELGANVAQWELAFAYVKRLREMNEQSHISSTKFQQNTASRLALPLPKN